MEAVAPSGKIYQAGTLSGNPLAMAAGIATLQELRKRDYEALEDRVEDFCRELEDVLLSRGIAVQIPRLASMFTVFFSASPVLDFASAKAADTASYARFFRHMRDNGVFLAPSPFETAMVSFVHSRDDFQTALKAARSFEG
jgi:glutamate-1-semialdehyde 2,1-aminomutase